MTRLDLINKKNDLLKKVETRVKIKNQLYRNMPIDSPMSTDEKLMVKQIADMYSEINTLVKRIRTFNN
jgi:hypothetical protein